MQVRLIALMLLAASLPGAEADSPKTAAQHLLDQSQSDLDGGKYGMAIENAQHCAAAFRLSSDYRNLASALRVLGLASLYSGSYPAGVESLTEGLALARQLHDFGSEIGRLNDLGMASYLMGRYRDALDRYEQAQARVREVPNDRWSPWARQVTTANIAILYQALGQFDRALELYSGLLNSSEALEPLEQAQLLSNIGALRRRLGDPVKSLDTYRKAQALYRGARHADGEIAVLNNIGIVQSMDLGDTKGAEQSFLAALQLSERSGNRPLAVRALLNRGEGRYRAGQAELSRADFAAAYDQARQLGLQDEEWRAMYGIARSGVLPDGAAHALLENAAGLIESLRERAGSTVLRSAFLSDKRAVYDRLIETSPSPGEAFQWSERSRARMLLESRPHMALPPSLDEFRRGLPTDTAVLEFWMGSKAAGVLWITASGAGMKRFTPDLKGLEQARKVLADPGNGGWRAALQPISAQLLSGIPVLDDPKIRKLRLIPDGPLALVPFEALPLGSSDLLIQRFSISYAPSATLSGRRDPKSASLRWPWQRSLAGFADPQAGSGEDDRVWAPLPHARSEVRRIAAIIGGKTEVHLGADAGKAQFSGAAAYPLIHLATHAQAEPQDPGSSFILLAPAFANVQRYGYLFSKELNALSFAKTDLVTLSACETNLGTFVPGEGLRGFSEAFLGAGARSVLNSLWSVSDVSTEELMTRFYSRLASGETAGDALRLAKLDFIGHPQSSHPAYWAAFVLTGDSDWRVPRLIGWPWLSGLALLAIVAAVIVIRTAAARASK